MVTRMEIDLWAYDSDFIALIVPMKTGVIWRPQVGGCRCHHPEVEGILIPLPPKWHNCENDPLYGFMDATTADAEEFLRFYPQLGDWFLASAHSEACEAWVPVVVTNNIKDCEMKPILEKFIGREAFLTYPNSD